MSEENDAFKVGDAVWCAANGKGTVIEIRKGVHSVVVNFVSEEKDYYTSDGQLSSRYERCLFFSKPTVQGATKRPKYKPKVMPGTILVMIMDGDCVGGAIKVLQDCEDRIISTMHFEYAKSTYEFYKVGEKVE